MATRRESKNRTHRDMRPSGPPNLARLWILFSSWALLMYLCTISHDSHAHVAPSIFILHPAVGNIHHPPGPFFFYIALYSIARRTIHLSYPDFRVGKATNQKENQFNQIQENLYLKSLFKCNQPWNNLQSQMQYSTGITFSQGIT